MLKVLTASELEIIQSALGKNTQTHTHTYTYTYYATLWGTYAFELFVISRHFHFTYVTRTVIKFHVLKSKLPLIRVLGKRWRGRGRLGRSGQLEACQGCQLAAARRRSGVAWLSF